MIVSFDSAAFHMLTRPDSIGKQKVRRILRTAQRLGRDVVVPTVVLAELYRGRGHNHLVDACLARERTSIGIRDTDRGLARIVGGVLAGAGSGSAQIVDAHVVAAAIESGGGVIVTGDPDDLEALSASYHHLTIEPV